MKKIKNKNVKKVSTRIYMLIGFLAALLVAIGVVGLLGISKSNNSLKTVYEDRVIALGQLNDINYLLQRERVLVMDMLLQQSPDHVAKRNIELASNIDKIANVWDAYMATYLTPEEVILANDFNAMKNLYVQDALIPVSKAMSSGRGDEGLALYKTKVSPMAPAVQLAAQKLNQLQLDVAKSEYESAIINYNFIKSISSASILIGVLLSIIFGVKLVRNISGELGGEPGEASDLARHVASGDLSRSIQLRPGDTTSMMAQLKRMQESLSVIVKNVRNGSESMATASAEIAQGNQDLSMRTESQASALEETAASMEELGSTVKQNADNVKQANILAINAKAFASKGGVVIGKVVDTMQEINDASRQIADIIGVIDSIAFQTNILALNAAVEAARAGEQGRGFAVVASEVRNLAGRSAQAAKEIKTLISTSVERVKQGTTLVNDAGFSITEIVDSIQKVNDLISEINTASNEQSLGIMQVGEAVMSMDQNTQQNATLVEQMAAAANMLKEQSEDLVATVDIFKIS
ncbi:MAG: methyl-accepting chemotaxis protein [Polynucleobacter sp.]|uniref:methyl-accepting chemotaxis protein n=1 Tax=Polynucleobacter sp. TaxID=2029855 RepID=UPI002723DFA6|nr:methyl-accepting chemotaxis protein [Polynucleobacter sp.]MDO8714004.1 methyl-accepting chemotaxis protein [Polynucleobacter sp.]